MRLSSDAVSEGATAHMGQLSLFTVRAASKIFHTLRFCLYLSAMGDEKDTTLVHRDKQH
jgi:hypothetical protein